MIITLILFTLANILLAFVDAHKFVKNKTVSHILNGVEYIAMLAIPYFIFHNYWMIGVLLFNRLLVFNIMLSLFRGLKWDYVTPENPPKSFIDRLAKMVFGMNGKLMYSIYAAIFIVLTVISFL